jgi:predicted nuclease of predicted toxin-antitoxin system
MRIWLRSYTGMGTTLFTCLMSHHSAADTEVMNRADRENRLLLTEDKDFGDLVFRQARPVPGIVLLRIEPSRRLRKAPRLLAAIDRFGDTLFGRYTVIEDARFRSRPLRSA